MVDLSFAGRLRESSPSLRAIAEARIGDPINIRAENGVWTLADARGRILGRMAKKNFSPPEHTRFARGEITAIIRRYREDNEEEFQRLLRRDTWEVVIPELVFEVTS